MRNPFDEPSATAEIKRARAKLHAEIPDDPDRFGDTMYVLVSLRSPMYGETDYVFAVDVQYAPFGTKLAAALQYVAITSVHTYNADTMIGPRIDTLYYRWPNGLTEAVREFAAALAIAGYGA